MKKKVQESDPWLLDLNFSTLLSGTWRAKVPGWTSLGRWGRSKVLRSSVVWFVVVPVVARMMKETERSLNFILCNQEIAIELNLPFSWKMLYASSVFFAIASIGFSRRCPDIVAHYPLPSDAIKEGRSMDFLKGRFAIAMGRVAADNSNAQPSLWRRRISDHANGFWIVAGRKGVDIPAFDLAVKQRPLAVELQAARYIGGFELDDENFAVAFAWLRDLEDRSDTSIRVVLTTLYGTGAVLALMVAAQNVLYVARF